LFAITGLLSQEIDQTTIFYRSCIKWAEKIDSDVFFLAVVLGN
jgi:hypothetical protein